MKQYLKRCTFLLVCLSLFALAGCGSSDSTSSSNSSSGVTLAKSVFNRADSSALQGSQRSQAIKSSVSGSAVASYNPATGQVTFPQLQVSGDTSGATYSVDMAFQGDLLVVTSLVMVGISTPTSATALYYPATGAVTVPYLTVSGDTSGTQYSVTLQQQGSSMNFSVANVALAATASVAGTYIGSNHGGSKDSAFTVSVSADGTMNMTGLAGNLMTGTVNVSTGDFTITASMPDGYNVNVLMTVAGHIDAASGVLTGTWSMTDSKGGVWNGTVSGIRYTGSVVASQDSAYANCVYFPNSGQYYIQAYIVDPGKNIQSASLTGYKITSPITYTYNLYSNLPGRWASTQNVLVSTGSPPTFPLNYTVTVKNMDGTTQSVNLVVTSLQVAQ